MTRRPCGAVVSTDRGQRLPSVHVGKPEVHEHQVGKLVPGEGDPGLGGVGAQDLGARRPRAASWPGPGSPECLRPRGWSPSGRLPGASAVLLEQAQQAVLADGLGQVAVGEVGHLAPRQRPTARSPGCLVLGVASSAPAARRGRRVRASGRRAGWPRVACGGRRSRRCSRARGHDPVAVAGEHLLEQRRDRRVVVHAEEHAAPRRQPDQARPLARRRARSGSRAAA